MKYLRLFESNSVIEDLKDICLELEDMEFSIQFERYIKDPDAYDLYIFNGVFLDKWEKFNYNLISEYVDRIEEYLGDKIKKILVVEAGTWHEYYPKDKVDLSSIYGIISGIKFEIVI